VDVHAGAVLLEDRLGQERRRLARVLGRVLDDVLVKLQRVRHLQQRQEAQIDLALARPANLVVVALGADAERLEHHHHRSAQVAERVVRRRGEVALLRAVGVAERGEALTAPLESLPRRPVSLLGLDLVEGGVGLLIEGDVIEDVELGLGTEVRDVRDAAGAQVRLGLHRHVARVARVGLPRDRIEHRADQRDRRRLVERVQDRRGCIREQQHVRLVDLLEAADRRAVEADPVGERLLVQRRERHPHVLPGARKVGELQIDHARGVALGQGEHIARLDSPIPRERPDAERLGGRSIQEVRNRH
jgi:hypothetical protein